MSVEVLRSAVGTASRPQNDSETGVVAGVGPAAAAVPSDEARGSGDGAAKEQVDEQAVTDSDCTRGYECGSPVASAGCGFSSSDEGGVEEALAEETAREWFRAAVEASWPYTIKDHILKQGRKRMTEAQVARRDRTLADY